MTIVKTHAAKLADQGMDYWAPGPVSGTMWALHPDSADPILVTAQYQIVGADAGTSAQRKAAWRADDLASAMAAGGRACYQSGAYLTGFERPLPQHEHFYPASRWAAADDEGHTETHADGACILFVPVDRNAPIEARHIPATPQPVAVPPARTRTYRRRAA